MQFILILFSCWLKIVFFFLTVSRCKSMFTEEQINYFKLCFIVTDELAEGLREIFKREWDNRYKATLGEWKDEPKNGMDFWSGESDRNRSRNAHFLRVIKKGNRAEWDCTMLFYAILFSDCIHSLSPAVQSNVNNLRKLRNEEFAHIARGHLSSLHFKNVVSNISTAFHALNLPTQNIREIINTTTFPSEELRQVLTKIDILQDEVSHH